MAAGSQTPADDAAGTPGPAAGDPDHPVQAPPHVPDLTPHDPSPPKVVEPEWVRLAVQERCRALCLLHGGMSSPSDAGD